MSLQAYQTTQRTTENPRHTEYRLFALVTRALIDVKDRPLPEVAAAVDWNRRLWLALQADLVHQDNKLPERLRAQLISLAIWVGKHSTKVIRMQQADVQPLINVNRSIMEGLAANVETAHPATLPASGVGGHSAAA